MRLLTGCVVLAAVLLVAACSDDEKSSITKEEFVQKANARCAEYNADLEKVASTVTTQEEALALITGTLIPGLRDTLADIRALGFPAADAAMLEQMMADTEKIIADVEADPSAVVAQTESPFADVNARLVAYGLTDCGAG